MGIIAEVRHELCKTNFAAIFQISREFKMATRIQVNIQQTHVSPTYVSLLSRLPLNLPFSFFSSLFSFSLLSFNFARNSNTVLFSTLFSFMKAQQLAHSSAMPDTGGHELTPSLASTVQETSIASTTSSGSSCVDNTGEEGGNFLLFLRRFGFGWSALVLVLAFSKLSIASFRLWNNIKVSSQLLYLQEHTVGLASDNIKKNERNIYDQRKKNQLVLTRRLRCSEMSHLPFTSLTFRFISSVVAGNTTSVPGRKNTNADFISLQPPDQIISESVGVVFLFEVLRAHRRMLAGFPMSTFRFHKIDPLLPSLLLFAFTFTEKRYGMKEYPFLFVSNIATTENNTFLRHGFTSDGSHNFWNSQSGFYVTNYTRPIPFRKVPRLGNGFWNLDFPPLWKFVKNSGFNQKQKFLRHFAQNYTKICLSKKHFRGL